LLKRRPQASGEAGRALYVAVVDQARRPEFYIDLGVPDSANGRFELYSLHVILLLRTLKTGDAAAGQTAQVLFDTYLSSLDDALREQGVGDLSMAKKMRKLGEAFYGRVRSYDEAFDSLPDAGPLEQLVARTAGAEGGDSVALADYVARALGCLAEQQASLIEGRVQWPEVRR
jgi:cytochrome b pre-mRNA-processing protein 3